MLTPEIRKYARQIFLLALIVRLAWCTLATVAPISDCLGYHTLACELLDHGRFHYSMGDAWRTPGYPGFVAGIYAVFGENVRAVGLAQALVGALCAALVVLIASKVAAPRTSLLAGLFQALWPTAVVYTPVLITENLAAPLVLLILLCIAGASGLAGGRRSVLFVVGGALFGLLVLVRPANLFFAPALVVLLLYDPPGRKWRPLGTLVFIAAGLVVVAPWLIRNYRLGFGFALSTQGGMSLWWGNNPQTDDGSGNPPRYPEEARMSERERDEFYRGKLLTWMRANPGRYAALTGIRAARFVGKEPDWFAATFGWPMDNDLAGKTHNHVPRERLMKYEERVRRIIAPLMLLAFAWSLLHWRTFALISLPVLSYWIGFSLTVFVERYRVPSDPLFVILLAVLLSDIVFGTQDLGPRRTTKAVLALGVIGASLFVHKTHLDHAWYALPPAPAPQSAPSTLPQSAPTTLPQSGPSARNGPA